MEYKIPWSRPCFSGDEKKAVLEALESGWISNGPFVNQFEQKVKEFTKVKHALAVSNGTTALHLAMMGLGIGPGDEVIVPGFTFIAPASMAKICGAKVIAADIDKDTFGLDTESVKKLINKNTKAIVAVHLYGNIVDMDPLLELANQHGIPIIEDNAESFGSTTQGRHAGTLGKVGTLSFHATKNITTGEGGMVLTNDDELYENMRTIREHGMRVRKTYWHNLAGHNFRLANMLAAMGCAQFNHFEMISKKRKQIHKDYLAALKSIPHFKPQEYGSVDAVLWVMAGRILTESDTKIRDKRDRIVTKLAEDGIETRPGFYSLDQLPPFEGLVKPQPNASLASDSVIVLPAYPDMTIDEIKYVATKLKQRLAEVNG